MTKLNANVNPEVKTTNDEVATPVDTSKKAEQVVRVTLNSIFQKRASQGSSCQLEYQGSMDKINPGPGPSC